MENEEIRGLMHKKASEDQFMAFVKFKFGALSLFSLSLTFDHLEFSWRTLTLDQGRKRKQMEMKASKDQVKESRIK